MSIVIVDDNHESRFMLEALLEEAGYENVVGLLDGAALLAHLGLVDGGSADPVAAARKVDCILAEAVLPDIDGVSLCRALKRNRDVAAIPVLLLTARLVPADSKEYGVAAAFDAGAYDYLRKPVNRLMLLHRVATAVALKTALDDCRALWLESRELKRKVAALRNRLTEQEMDPNSGPIHGGRFDALLEIEWDRARQLGDAVSVLLIQAEVDTVGRAPLEEPSYGARCREVATLIAEAARTAQHTIVVRVGPLRFAVLLRGTRLPDASRVAMRIAEAAEALSTTLTEAQVGSLAVCVGVASSDLEPGAGMYGVLEGASSALDRALAAGRGRVIVAEPELPSGEAGKSPLTFA